MGINWWQAGATAGLILATLYLVVIWDDSMIINVRRTTMKYAKALAALVPMLALGLKMAGVDLPPGWTESAIAVATPILVWAIPNKGAVA